MIGTSSSLIYQSGYLNLSERFPETWEAFGLDNDDDEGDVIDVYF